MGVLRAFRLYFQVSTSGRLGESKPASKIGAKLYSIIAAHVDVEDEHVGGVVGPADGEQRRIGRPLEAGDAREGVRVEVARAPHAVRLQIHLPDDHHAVLRACNIQYVGVNTESQAFLLRGFHMRLFARAIY